MLQILSRRVPGWANCPHAVHACPNMKTPIRQILVPVDFSPPSQQALDFASEIGKPSAASIDLLYVYEVPAFLPVGALVETGPSDAALVDLMRKNAETVLDGFMAEARKRGVPVRSARAELGPPPQTICAVAKSGGYDLIVIGTHGRTGLSHALIGSVAERVVRNAPCPVLSVRPHVG
jgi:nucleotide-binding universal stress UspA family protein